MTSVTAELARMITRSSSKQSYYTARLMVDQGLEDDCFRAYGYFRWIDDMVDIECTNKADRLVFIQRQKNLVEHLFQGEHPVDLTSEEEILVDLVHNDRGESNRLRSYIRNFMAIIEFDASRKGCQINQNELDWYASTLGKAVTDGIQYFVNNEFSYPDSEQRYLAATGAHITHMLRDMIEDFQLGYFNIPEEIFDIQKLDRQLFNSLEMRTWVKDRVQLARGYFGKGKQYLNKLPVLRCRIVGYWYCARFESVLDIIESDGYSLRSTYKKEKKYVAWLKFAGIALKQTWHHALFHTQNGFGRCGFPNNQVENSFKVSPD